MRDTLRLRVVNAIAAIAVVASISADSAEPSSPTKGVEESVAAEIRRSLTCTSIAKAKEGNLYCNLAYRGLAVEIAGANAPGGGSIFVRAMGKNQSITIEGRHCILVIFDDPDLKPEEIGAYILIRDDATISSNHGNVKARKACQ